MRDSRNIRVWGFTMVALALLVYAGLRIDVLTWGAVGIMSALGIATSLFSFRIDERTSVTFGPAVYMGAVALFGPMVAVWVAAISSLVLELVRFRRGGAPAFARVGIQVIGVIAAAGVYRAVRGVVGPASLSLVDVGRFALMFAVFTGITATFSASVDEPAEKQPRRQLRWLSGRGVVIELAMLPLSLLLVASYIPNEPATFPLLAAVLMISSAAGQKMWDTQQKMTARVNELRMLNTLGDSLSCSVRLDDLVRVLHQHTREHLGAAVTTLALHDDKKDSLNCRTCIRERCDISSHVSSDEECCASLVASGGETLYVDDLAASESEQIHPYVADVAEREGVELRSWFGVPLVAEDKPVGVLSIMSETPKAFDEETREVMQTMASQVGKVVATAVLYERLEEAQRSTASWNRKLEQNVSERTKELDKAKEDLELLNQDLERRVEKRTRELQEVQTRIVESGRLAAVGELAAGVAHELNNPLAGIIGYAQFDLEKLNGAGLESLTQEDLDKFRGHLDFIEQGAQRCTEIVESLLHFAQGSGGASTEVDVNEVVEETLGFTGRELSSRGIELRTELAPEGVAVMGDARQLQQVFANIVLNARKAMPSGGKLSVRTSVVQGDGGKNVAVAFVDTGCGIAKESIMRVFEPFFTTDDVGRGSGLGLSVSYGIVKEHGGNIKVQSKVGVGSTFTVLLPLAKTDEARPQLEGRA